MYIYTCMYKYIHIYQEAACTARICFTGVFLHGTALHVAIKEPHCTALHRPAGKEVMHGFARNTCNWISRFTYLRGAAWKVPVHMDPSLALVMELNSARRCL